MSSILRVAATYLALLAAIIFYVSEPFPIPPGSMDDSGANGTSTKKQDCFNDDLDNFVSDTLHSIQDFTLVGNPDFGYLEFDPDHVQLQLARGDRFRLPVSPGVSITIADSSRAGMSHSSFVTKVNGRTISNPDLYAYRGLTTELQSRDLNTNSLVALYARPSSQMMDQDHPGFVSGYIVTDVRDPKEPWYFIEPLRPLLNQVLASRQGTGVMSAASLKACLPASHNVHIVYEAGNTRDFSSELEPARWAKLSVTEFDVPFVSQSNQVTVNITVTNMARQESVDQTQTDGQGRLVDEVELYLGGVNGQRIRSQEVRLPSGDQKSESFTVTLPEGVHRLTARTDGNAMTRMIKVLSDGDELEELEPEFESLPIVTVADEDFFDLYTTTIEDQTWWDGLMEVTNLIDAFYSTQFPGLRLKVAALEAWNSSRNGPGKPVPDYDSDGKPDINAYTLLCHFAQGFVEHRPSAKDVPKTPSGSPGLVHLFTGYDLGQIPNDSAISDAGGGLCHSSCSKVGNDVVGLAEGIGGFRHLSSSTCQNGSHKRPVEFDPSADHGLSQHGPKNFQGVPDDPKPNTNYEATLYQRFILMAHEIGHNLGANHSPDKMSIMHTPLQNKIRFKLDNAPYPRGQNNKVEIRSCWLFC